MIVKNKQAYFNYSILETLEAGLVLSGAEVKSVKKNQVNLKGAYINIPNESQAFLINAHISPYKPASLTQYNYAPTRKRNLLLHKKQLKSLLGKSKQAGISIIPLKIYTKNRLIKLEIGIAQGKKKYDKRESIKKKDFDRRKRKLIG
ncbi:MAG: SsrA-binding protein SmpB [Candidatus Kuenenbacteria bacterium]